LLIRTHCVGLDGFRLIIGSVHTVYEEYTTKLSSIIMPQDESATVFRKSLLGPQWFSDESKINDP